MKFRVIGIREIKNPAHVLVTSLGDVAKEFRTDVAKEPEFVYEVECTLVDGNARRGELHLTFAYVPLLEVGTTYKVEELGDL